MPLQSNGSAPYTTAAAVTSVLDAWRDRGFGTPVTADVLHRVGVPESLARRTLQSLVLLELVGADGQPTQQFVDFRATRGEAEYRTRLQEWLRALYQDVLQYADPSTDPHDRITEAFRGYQPEGQRRAMASLLIGLWRYSGLPVAEGSTANGSARPRPARAVRQSGSAAPRRSQPKPSQEREGTAFDSADLPPGLVGLLRQIPREGSSWTTKRRDAFLQAFEAVLDFSVPVDDSPPDTGTGADQEDDV